MNTVFYNGRFTEVPASWNELTGKQLVRVIKIITGPYLPEVQRIRLLQVLLRWSWWKLALTLGMLRFWELPSHQSSLRKLELFSKAVDRTVRMAEAAEELTAFIFEGNTLTRNLLPHYRGHYGPADSGANLRMAEFAFAENYFLAWKQNSSTADLNKLIAVLWRPGVNSKQRRAEGDVRNRFVPSLLEAHAAKVDRWPIEVKMAMAIIYDGMRKSKLQGNMVFDGKHEEAESLYGLWSVMRMVAKAGHFGTFSQVEELYVDTVLMELNEAMAEAERLDAAPAGPREAAAMAAPIMSGVVALMYSVEPTLTFDEVWSILRTTATPFAASSPCSVGVGTDSQLCGIGIVNAGAAVEAAIKLR